MKSMLALLLSLFLWVGVSNPASAQLSPDDLQQLCAPIALYPDPLLSNVLAASTYPDEVAAAAQWMQRVGPIAPQNIDAALSGQGWDPTVKALVAFPDVLNYMANNMAWTAALGNAFLAQQPDVFQAVQSLRLQAQSAGNLGSTDQQVVENDGGSIVIEPSDPNTLYVPSYDPGLVYYQPQPSGLALAFGAGILIDRFLWMGVPDWNDNRLYFGRGYNSYYRGRGNGNNYYNNVRANIGNNQGAWRFNNQHRGGRAVPTASQLQPGRGYNNYRAPQSGRTTIPTANNRRPNYSPSTGNQRPINNNNSTTKSPSLGGGNRTPQNNPPTYRPATGNQRPNYQPATQQPYRNPTGGQTPRQNYQPPVQTAPNRNYPSGFNVGSGANVNQDSNRGASSRNQNRPTPVAPIPQRQAPQIQRQAPQQQRSAPPPQQNRSALGGKRK